nr:aminomethyl-transferring glycine dehydrogenase subunit GcvPA [Planctomycetota bacterium]
MPYIQNTDADRQAMLAEIGVSSVDELFHSIPAELRLQGGLPLEAGLTEGQLTARLAAMASWNRPASARPNFLGGGFYDHGWCAAVDELAGRSEFLTAYTPYQPECSQGTLQWIFEFQSMIAELCGMETANASMYDGASACAEAALMAIGITRRSRGVVAAGRPPHARDTRPPSLRPQDVERVEAPLRDGVTDWAGVVDEATAAVFVQQPNFLGLVEPLGPAKEVAERHGALAVASVSPVAMGLLRSPGAAGFDLVVGEGQGLGVPLGYGGPHFGFFAAREKFVRKLPGRLVGSSVDRQGRRAFTLTFQTREQHIRREKATSNICTNNALMALRGCIHMAALGPAGLEEVACVSRQRALELRDALCALDAVEEAFPAQAFFQEVPLRLTGGDPAVARLKQAAAAAGIAAVLAVSCRYPGREGAFTPAPTAPTPPAGIPPPPDRA